MLKAIVPKNTTQISRAVWPLLIRSEKASLKTGFGSERSSLLIGLILSCFQSAIRLRRSPIIAAPWTTRINNKLVKSRSNQPIISADIPMPTRNITYSNATTRGRFSSLARSLANAKPAVWVMCKPIPVIMNASAAKTSPAQLGPKV